MSTAVFVLLCAGFSWWLSLCVNTVSVRPLRIRYKTAGRPPALFLSSLFAAFTRYDLLGRSTLHQAALPAAVFDVLHSQFGVRKECFASPFDCCHKLHDYFSPFPDTDR